MAGTAPAKCALPSPELTAIHADGKSLPTSARYVLVDNDHVYPLKVGINTVGRMPDNDVVVADPYVSRRHVAVVVHAHGGCELHDIASKNGTLLNGRGISGPTRLHTGDHIRLSDHLLIFLCNGEEDPQAQLDHTQAD
jgi:pSer/pThr/pTyr-binding forkhead associated (FHA) protein